MGLCIVFCLRVFACSFCLIMGVYGSLDSVCCRLLAFAKIFGWFRGFVLFNRKNENKLENCFVSKEKSTVKNKTPRLLVFIKKNKNNTEKVTES